MAGNHPDPGILVVEDDPAIRRLVMMVLQKHGYHVEGAADGLEAVLKLGLVDYDVIVLDLMMPHMSGVDFLTSLEALQSDPSVRIAFKAPAILIITSFPPEEVPSDDLAQRFPRYVRGVLRKPLDMARLGQCVEDLLR